MQTKKIVIPALLAAMLLVATAYAEEDFVPHGWQALTDEQLETMLEKRLQLLEEGLDRTEIREEIQEYRAEQGITGPYFVDEDGDGVCDHAGQGYGKGAGGGGYGRGMGQGFGHKGRW